VTEEIRARQTAEETRSAVESGQRADTGGARRGAERKARQINRYLYENLVSNVEGQIEYWNRRASHESNPHAADVLRHKAEGLGYALRLLNAFQPEFHELVAKAEDRKCQGCGGALEYSDFRQASDSDLCDSCYEIGRDGETSVAERARNSVPLTNLAAE
jgi:hypothetical protein